MTKRVITGTVDIDHRTVYFDDVIADDALFNIVADARLVLAGDDQFDDDTLAMAGQLRNRGALVVDGLTLKGSVVLVNAATITQTGDVTLGASSDDAVVVRNLVGATWESIGDDLISLISQPGANSRFVNLGSIEQTGRDDSLGLPDDFINRGTVQSEGTVTFGDSPRLFGQVSTGLVRGADIFLDGAAITATVTARSLTVLNSATITAEELTLDADGDNVGVYLRNGARLTLQVGYYITLGRVQGVGEIDLDSAAAPFGSYPDGVTLTGSYPDELFLTGDIKFVNSGAVSTIPLYQYTSQAFIFVATPTNGGTVEIDNLAGAAWIDSNDDTTFDGDGTD